MPATIGLSQIESQEPGIPSKSPTWEAGTPVLKPSPAAFWGAHLYKGGIGGAVRTQTQAPQHGLQASQAAS